MTGTIPGGRYAFQVVHPGSPMLRIRYRRGVAIDPYGFPDWIPYARALVELPPADPALGIDEARVLDVLTANTATRSGGGATPDGWTWAHVARSRRIALVPAELHGAFRHLGGVSTGAADRARLGVPVQGEPPPIVVTERLSEAAVRAIEQRLGGALPSAYRSFLARTNGGRPGRPAVHPGFGFVADQPFFGADRVDWLQDLVYANAWFGDRLTADWLAIGYVQGGLIAVRVRGGDEGSVWFYDDDDPRDSGGYEAADVCARLLHRCADDFAAFWRALREPAPALLTRVRAAAAESVLVLDERLGSALPPSRSPAR